MDKEDKTTFGIYLRHLRESRELNLRAVEEKIIKLFPDDKHAHLSHSHLNQIEKDNASPPSPLKLKSLAKIYGENYEFMLYKAGYLERNPLAGPEEWPSDIIRDFYFGHILGIKNWSSLGENEKRSNEKMMKDLMLKITGVVA